jgi:hypothetical protein
LQNDFKHFFHFLIFFCLRYKQVYIYIHICI